MSNKQCRNPRCDIHEYTRTLYVPVYNHTTGIYHYSFLNITIESSYVSNDQKQAFSKRLKNMSAPSPVISMQTPQREFAGAKVQKNFDVCK